MVFTGLPSTVLPPYAEALLPCSQKRGEAGLDATAIESVSIVGSDEVAFEGEERGERDKMPLFAGYPKSAPGRIRTSDTRFRKAGKYAFPCSSLRVAGENPA